MRKGLAKAKTIKRMSITHRILLQSNNLRIVPSVCLNCNLESAQSVQLSKLSVGDLSWPNYLLGEYLLATSSRKVN